MPRKAKKAAAKEADNSGNTITHGGRVIESKVVTGKNTQLTAHQQGQLARGEIDENLQPTGKAARKPGDTRTVKSDMTLYQGKITMHAVAGATGEKVSVVAVQAEPTTEHGLFHHFLQYHPSAIRDTFEVDPDNETDPTLRTSLEK